MNEHPIPAEEAVETQHEVTQEDLKNSPELVEQGVREGETVGIPCESAEPPADGAALSGGIPE